ncbi:MAG: hypothetical protein Q8Q62_15315 [Mesorhizobium sp.]|nr:hypothetical protein [Mesorhizobium sp.]
MAMTDMTVGVPIVASADETSYVDWAAILAGTVLATAISFVLLTFGSAIGLSFSSAYEGRGMSLVVFAIVAALWLLWVQISSFLAGGYLTGRLRRRKHDATEYESDIRDGSHGLIMWAVGVLLGAAIAISGITAAVSTATTAVTTVAAGAAAGSAGELVDGNALTIDRFLRGGGTPDQPTADARGEVGRILATSLANDTLEADDRAYLATTVAARTGLDQAAAEQRVDQLWAQAQQAEAEARAAADLARRIAMIAAFLTAASLLISSVAAYYGATLGGNHRDKQVVFSDWVKPW